MPEYSDKEYKEYFKNKGNRRRGYRGFVEGRVKNPRLAQAVRVLSIPTILGLLGVVVITGYMISLRGDIPSFEQIENPEWELATVAYTADGVELARFGRQNRSSVRYDSIPQHVKDALIATEDHRFGQHWGIDLFRTASAASQSALWKIGLPFSRQGGSTITQQLARNLYNEQIGFAVTVERKLKEMVTAVELERRYTKEEIVEMYLNTVSFRHNAFGIEAAARTYFGKPVSKVDTLEGATLIGMLQGTTRYDPVRSPEASRNRRNVVLRQMIKRGLLDTAFYETYRDSLTATNFRSADVTESFAPYFAEYVRNWLSAWGKEHGVDIYGEGLRVWTTLDSRLQTYAQEAVRHTMQGLQAVADCEWGLREGARVHFGEDLAAHREAACHTESENRFAYFWQRNASLLTSFIRESDRFQNLRRRGMRADSALAALRGDPAFIDSLKAEKTRLETGLTSVDPRTGHVKAWVGGRDLAEDWFDHVAIARRQPGSTFKPFVFTAAVDVGHKPWEELQDTLFTYVDEYTDQAWSPQNSGGEISSEWLTLREGLARSLNTISGQLILNIGPSTVARYAEWMGIRSPLDEVPSLALGTSDVTLLEMATAYSTLANLGIRNDPVIVTRIEDENGTVLYEAVSAPGEALSDETAAVVIDMLRDVVNEEYGTGYRIRWQFEQAGYDFAGKTGTTQEGADGWFMLMHPELVTGAWVGFNDRRVTFRSTFWGQGAHNALFVVGDYLQRANGSPEVGLTMAERFPPPEAFGYESPGRNRENQREVW